MLSCDSDVNIENEFFTALALFKSTAKNSDVKLREMLLASIARKKKFSNHDKKIPFPVSAYESANEISKKLNSHIEKQFKNTKSIYNNTINNENQMDANEIPRISIPDDEFNDFITCKICDGAKIGPFILLECQDCSDTYHPLCHQPPVIDIDIYDPRLVWRCSNCICIDKGIPSEISLTLNTIDKMENNNINNDENTQNVNDNIFVKLDSKTKIKKHPFIRTNNIEKREVTKGMMKEKYTTMGNQIRKRIGSKLTVPRISLK